MKIRDKREIQQIGYNHSSDIDFKDFINLYKNVLENHFFFYLMMLLLDQIILNVKERIFQKEYKN